MICKKFFGYGSGVKKSISSHFFWEKCGYARHIKCISL